MIKLNWKKGRQENSNYLLVTLFSSLFWRMDCHLLKYPKNGFIKRHKDPLPEGRKHYRLNISLNHNIGLFICEGPHREWWRFRLFRPDLFYHYYYNLDNKSRYVLSLGISIKGRNDSRPVIWNWKPITKEEEYFGRIDYENHIPFLTKEMADRIREDREQSRLDYEEELKKFEQINKTLERSLR